MLRTTLAGLRAHRLRLLLTGLAITLGVAFVSGTFVLTDMMGASVSRQLAGSADRFDVIVLPGESEEGAERTEDPAIPADVLAEVGAVPGVAAAAGEIVAQTPLLDADGRAIGFMPTYGVSLPADPELLRYPVVEGTVPTADDEVALDTGTAEDTGFAVGDRVEVLDADQERHGFTVTGLIDLGANAMAAIGGGVGFAPATAERMAGGGDFAEIHVLGAGGDPAELRDAVAAALGGGYEVVTGAERAAALVEASGGDNQVLAIGLLLFALVALFVAGLVIYNTFTILVAQRTRELALLRCVGAERAQVFGAVLLEAAVVGLLASAVGVAAGIGLGAGGYAALSAVQGDTPIAPVIGWHTVLVGLVAGTVVTVVAALLPARRATTIAPVAALRSQPETDEGRRAGAVRIGLAALFAAGGTALTWYGIVLGTGGTLEPGMLLVAAGGIVSFLGVLAIGPNLVAGLVRLLGWAPARLLGVPTRLAVANTRRNPRRAATTTVALTVGVTLITLFAVVTASLRASYDQALEDRYPVDVLAQPQMSAEGAIPREVAAGLRADPAVRSVVEVRSAEARLDGTEQRVAALDGAELADIATGAVAGDPAGLGPGTVAVAEDVAAAEGLSVGDTVALDGGGGTGELTVVAVLEPMDLPVPGVVLAGTDFDRYFGADHPAERLLVSSADREDSSAAEAAVSGALAELPAIQVQTVDVMRQEMTAALDQLLLVMAGLVGLAVVIALFGIANTLTLSVVERTRESAMLRALGLTRGQLRRMLLVEAVLISVIGALIGVVLGVVFGWAAVVTAFTSTMSGEVLTTVPAGQIGVFLAVAALAGVLASVLPARRAARDSVVAALAGE
ncbi:ABC transporter permease [Allonocardiopsis opalescens]|uniref:Putative ABC transport system permease protein n=1 Tax=Allonocardiopsis opalescens TaxID=1144618 RepID=A0A2T0Q230_9ACTN|nr:FtsX-like permease family protein [Allonocardiopsis opalescens]PRX97831.1 putative ABC transport system permease protein [Allonocardiopsis opalescens]